MASKKDECPKCKNGSPMWMATFADMATLLMSFFVLLIAFAEMEKQDSVMASEGQTGKNLGVQDEIPAENAPPVNEGEQEDDGLKKADADTDAGFEIVKAAMEKEITEGKVEVSIKDMQIVVEVAKSETAEATDGARILQEQLEIYAKVADAQTKIEVGLKISQEADDVSAEQLAREAAIAEQYRRIRETLADEIDKELVEVIREGEIIIVRLAEQGSFKSGAAELQPGFNKLLDKVGVSLTGADGLITIEGHTDNVPVAFSERFRSNWDLSAARSAAVADYLLDSASLKGGNVMVTGLADTKPIMSNDTSEGRAKNRRIEIVIDGS
ncbi:MAG: OmpA family protein [Porticoccaceae bacterium]|nr:OmpA family protein [Porticoccaceae bacterium]